MPDHVHLMLTPLPDETGWPRSLNNILRGLKGTSAHRINQLGGTSGQVWQRESFDHVLRTNESMREKIDHIRQNPVRKGLVCTHEQYAWLWVHPDWR
jgi:REP element-mobilizing transposase RayT